MRVNASEAELLAGVRRGDEHAFRQLYQRHSQAAYAVALRLLGGHRPDADDALQETWLRAVRGLAGFRGDSSFRTWLVGIAIRTALEAGRARVAKASGVVAPDPAGPCQPELRLDLERLIHRLPHGYRHVLVLHDIQGHTHEEIARLLDIEPGTSKSQLSRARALLRRWLCDSFEGQRHG
jgi:RNA polymerase sigma-70 factor (ECF subfamily)